ncbi:glycosyl hydrolase [Plebeiibacterium marinum]|uniref:Glycosyl hydrolase n=1 Tax=Plebeiibacterium marinum TaxID=2992111 RepID=A0AAE3SJ34_9BACT|nr:glycosyl hydrolase [Plebeiobacterium marinum]MCW3805355.1 glycosyl hydrolase [Plebeiobacterium marinum]
MSRMIFSCLLLVYLMACTKSEDVERLAPNFKSSIPDNNATDVAVTTSIEIVFDEVISLIPNHGITINDIDVEVETSFTKLLFTTELSGSTTYTIIVPAGSLVNTNNVPLEEELKIVFTTKDLIETTINPNLVGENSSKEAVNVYNFLIDNYGVNCLSATQACGAWNLNEAEWVKYHTGKYPVIANFDYGHLPYSPANWIDYSKTDFVEEWWINNGLIGASWHWVVPKYEGSTEYTYKPDETTFRTSNVLIEGTWENQVAKQDLEKLANYLKLLKNKNIPVLWRPFHEASGNKYEYNGGSAWFWWGDAGGDVYKLLWIYMFEYFESQGLNNLIWVWTTQTKDADYYPGDKYVDIIGRDIYGNNTTTYFVEQFEMIQEIYPNKMVTLSEMGNVSRITSQWSDGAKWSYFMPWYDYNRTNDVHSNTFTSPDHEHANSDWWADAINSDFVITRDEMPDLK